MSTENIQRFADDVCRRDVPCWKGKPWDITDVEGRKLSNLLSEYTDSIGIHIRTTVSFVLENVNKK
jgi:hypothetical protein